MKIPHKRSIASFTEAAPEVFRKPDLHSFRRLQWIMLLVAICWLLGGSLVSWRLADSFVGAELERHHHLVQQQADILALLVSKELETADKLAMALSQDASVIALQQAMNGQAEHLKGMTPNSRKSWLEAETKSQAADALITRLLSDVGMMSVFVLDSSGNCVATGYTKMVGEKQRLGCLGENYQNRDYFTQAKDHGHGYQFAVGKRVPLPSVFFARASKSGDSFTGAAVVRVEASNLLSDIPVSAAQSWITDQHGMIISSTEPEHLLQKLGTNLYPPVKKRVLEATYQQTSARQIPLEKSEAFSEHWQYWELNNAHYFLAQAPVGSLDFTVWHSSSVEIFSRFYHRSWLLAVVVLVAGLLLILVIERVFDASQRRLTHLQALNEAHKSLEQVSGQLYNIAITDDLTHLSSRGYFYQRLEEEAARALREERQLILLQIDIDNFKTINDSYGHPAGDAAIRQMASYCRKNAREVDLVGRIGGEEFAIGLIDCALETGEKIAEKIRRVCEQSDLVFEGTRFNFTCSIGLAVLSDYPSVESLVRNADMAMYLAKKAGRNCVRKA